MKREKWMRVLGGVQSVAAGKRTKTDDIYETERARIVNMRRTCTE